jgi:probable rRNA maturation factor
VVISLQTAQRQARAWGRPLDEEVARYLAHGLLHLLGHDHHRREEAARMRAQEERLLGIPGMLGPAARVDARSVPRSSR